MGHPARIKRSIDVDGFTIAVLIATLLFCALTALVLIGIF
jgi:hypothetical protein